MARPSHDPSISDEPHFRSDAVRADQSEAKAERALRHDPDTPESTAASGQSVFEEPDIFPHRPAEVIGQDWSCSHCGYNLRGLEVGHPCPECGRHELYRPAPGHALSYRTWLQAKIAATPRRTGWFIAVGLALGGGLFSILGALFENQQQGLAGLSFLMVAAVFGPVVEETLKIALAAITVETRPYLFQRPGQILLATLGAALLFAAIENVIYLNIYVPNPSDVMFIWRWTVCVLLHVGCTGIASRGVIRVWEQTTSQLRRPSITQALPMLVTAIVVHGTYNATATLFAFATT